MNQIKNWTMIPMLVVVLLALVGCAGVGSEASRNGEGRGEIITDSDETDHRKRARIRFELAVGYFEQNKINIALDEIKHTLTADASFGPAHNLRGMIYAQLNENKLAEDSFRRAMSLNGKDVDAIHNLGWLLCQQRRYDDAQRLFDDVTSGFTFAVITKTWLTKGLCYARAGLFPQAEKALLRAYELDPSNPITAYNLSLVFYHQELFDKTKFYIRRLNESEFSNSETLWLQAKAENKLGNTLEVRRLGKRLVDQFANSKEASLYLRGRFDD